MPIKEIKNYVVAYYAGAKNLTGHAYRAIISLRDENNALLGAAYFTIAKRACQILTRKKRAASSHAIITRTTTRTCSISYVTRNRFISNLKSPRVE